MWGSLESYLIAAFFCIVGACLFTISSIYGFADGWNAWDASRVTAAIPSGK